LNCEECGKPIPLQKDVLWCPECRMKKLQALSARMDEGLADEYGKCCGFLIKYGLECPACGRKITQNGGKE